MRKTAIKLWGQPVKGRDGDGSVMSTTELGTLDQYQKVAEQTLDLIHKRGWCLWKCETLDGDTILIADNFAEDLPDGYPIYSMSELEILFGGDKPVSRNTLRLVHEAKKLAGAKVTTKVTNNEGGNRE